MPFSYMVTLLRRLGNHFNEGAKFYDNSCDSISVTSVADSCITESSVLFNTRISYSQFFLFLSLCPFLFGVFVEFVQQIRSHRENVCTFAYTCKRRNFLFLLSGFFVQPRKSCSERILRVLPMD